VVLSGDSSLRAKRQRDTFVFLISGGRKPQTMFETLSKSRFFRRYLARPYLLTNVSVWKRLPPWLVSWRVVRAYGAHIHNLVLLWAARTQYFGTFFLRNRPELELLIRVLNQKGRSATLDLTILACSKGAEVYSFSHAIRCARPDLKMNLRALDISEEILEFAAKGAYSTSHDGSGASDLRRAAMDEDVAANTLKDQGSSVFERMSSVEMEAMFDREEDQVRVKPRFREGITWHLGDAGDAGLIDVLGLQDVVVANRFLCHMPPDVAERCLRNLARLVKPGGYLFVSGVDLAVRSKVARDLGWMPVPELIREIHEGDPSLRLGWPLQWWGLEPFDRSRTDWNIRYASVFQIAKSV
jgi:chemotaxis methyl-accepting protein methylase